VKVAEMGDDVGMMSVPPGGFEEALGPIVQRLGNRPMLLAGMVGSNRGWREAPYVGLPASEHDLARNLTWIDPVRIGIVPGLSMANDGRADVMRGEEVQVFGLTGLDGFSGDCTICHPGTHTKWIQRRDGKVTDFLTVMTGELFSLLREYSILSPLLREEPQVNEAFCTGVDATLASGVLSAELFSVRARVLLDRMDASDAPSYASGLLIGSDLRAGLSLAVSDEVVVLGRPSLTRMYAAALARCGRKPREADGALAFIAGMNAIKKALP
jgi:2-dehydro-3-deoxygalactonokinase